jgi:hypothetical protein
MEQNSLYPCQQAVLEHKIIKTKTNDIFSPEFGSTGVKCLICHCGTYITHNSKETISNEQLISAITDMCNACCKYQNEKPRSTGWVICPDLVESDGRALHVPKYK